MSEEKDPDRPADFAEQAACEDPGLVAEFLQFLREEKKWWLLPILVTLLVLSGLILIGGSSLAPFIYALF